MSKSPGSKCPSCNRAATGNFCQHCGTKLGGRFCNQCGTELTGNAAFCNQCGTKVGGGAAVSSGRREAAAATVGGNNLPWWIAGAAMFALILFIGLRMVTPGGPAAPTGGAAPGFAAPPGGSAGITDISQMTPIEAATRLFNRVMTYVAEGDSTSAQGFMPMAIASYERARPLDLDGLFHLSMLNRTAMNLDAALANALEILDQDPDHLLGLSAAAQAAAEMGRSDEAAGYYRTIVESYDGAMATPLVEYLDHPGIVDTLKEEAEAFLAGR